ncbi:MAG: NAD(P)H-binding protein [Ferruginibacter sp.]
MQTFINKIPFRAVVVGGSGVTGRALVKHLIDSKDCTEVYSLVRKRFPPPHDKMRQMVVTDYSNYEPLRHILEGFDVMFCTIGTTKEKVNNDMNQYRAVDIDIPVYAAKAALAEGTQTLVIVSSVGADAASSNFYLKIKGEMEKAISDIPIPRIVFMRPSVLLDERKGKRKGVYFLQSVIAIIQRILVGKLTKYRPIRAEELAAAMIEAAKGKEAGRFVWHWENMQTSVIK